ncbi:MAG: DUF2723 domain-containing protein [bacterium]|nr:DUF2723 domain-containing protein [bacterium]
MEPLLNRLRRPHILIAAGVFALTLGVYVTTLGPTMEFWDCGEFITTSHIVGIPHQPGTPMYVLMGRVFDVIFGSPQIDEPAFRTAWALNFMSAFFSALAVTFVFLLIRDLARRADPDVKWLPELGGVVGALFLAFSQTYWNNAIEAEVYGLSAFMLAVLSWLAVRWYDHRDHDSSNHLLFLMIYLLGLGVGFHLGSVLVYPGVFLMVLLASRRQLPVLDLFLMSAGLFVFLLSTTTRDNGLVLLLLLAYAVVVGVRAMQGHRFALVGSALFFVGLTVHVMMLVRAGANPEPLINQTDPDNFAALMTVIRREQYPPLNPFQRQADLGWQYGYYYGFLFKQFYFLGPGHGLLTVVTTVLGPIFLALVGLFHGVRRLFPLVLIPLAGYLFNGEILTLYLNFTDHEVRERDYFYFAAFLFMAVFIGLGAAALMRYAQGGEGKSADQVERDDADWRRVVRATPRWSVWLVAGVLLVAALLPIAPGSVKYWEHDRSENHLAYDYAWNILAGLDENAIIFTNGDNDTFPIWYLQMVEKFRTDVTVVNLSLVNLPWYIKQLRYHHGLEFSRTDEEVDRLRHRMFEDPETGQRELVMIKDYVVHDIITTNLSQVGRPLFFAVTIPQDNMKRYFANLRMEGMAYRLVRETAPDNLPTTNADKVMENMLGVYRLDSVQSGDSEERQRRYAAMAGRASDDGTIILGRPGKRLSAADMADLAAGLGQRRRDTFRSINARHLLGNYPTAFNRAGFDFIQQSELVAETDSVAYRELLAKAATAFEASLALEPFNDHAMDFYPLLLVQLYRDDDARDFLISLRGNVDEALEEQIIFRTFQGLIQGGLSPIALGWARQWRQDDPGRGFYYMLEFRLYEAMDELAAASAIADEWATVDGARNAEMDRSLAEMQQRARARDLENVPATGGGTDGQ